MKHIITALFIAISILAAAQNQLRVKQSNHLTSGIELDQIDSLTFNTAADTLIINMKEETVKLPMASVDTLSFGLSSDTVSIYYQDTTAFITNPLAYSGVSVRKTGADVTITSTATTKGIVYRLSGSTTDGSFKLYSEKNLKISMDNVSLANTNGPAINIQTGKAIYVNLEAGTTNYLADGNTYATAATGSDGEPEDQDAAFFSEGQLIFNGSGSLTIAATGSDAHALCSDDYIEFNSGNLLISSSVKDGIHTNDGLFITDGNIQVTASGDGIDVDEGVFEMTGGTLTVTCSSEDVKAIACDSTLNISGGTLTLQVNGNQSKGLKSKQNITLTDGTITITTKGAAVLVSTGTTGRYDPSYCTAVKSNANLTITGGTLTINSSGAGGKGLSADSSLVISGGTTTINTTGNGASYTNASGTADAYTATCITADGSITITGGTVTTKSTGTGGRGINADGTITVGDSENAPVLNVTTTGSKITVTSSTSTREDDGTYAEAKAIKADGAITVNNGTLTIASSDDGIKSTSAVTLNGGTTTISGSTEGIEGPLLTVNDGTISVTSSDDCFNATKGNGGETNDGSYLYFNGGSVYASTTAGDGLDSNGSIVMTGGTVAVQGPGSQPEVCIDYNGTFLISGGILAASGPNGNMIQATSTSSAQYTAMIKSTAIGTNLIHIQDASGTDLLTYKPTRSAYYLVFSTPSFSSGKTYSIYSGGSSTGTSTNGYYQGGTYSGGTLKKTFTLSSKVTTVTF